MTKTKQEKKPQKLRHVPFEESNTANVLKSKKAQKKLANQNAESDDEDVIDDVNIPSKIKGNIVREARRQRLENDDFSEDEDEEINNSSNRKAVSFNDNDDDEEDMEEYDEEEEDGGEDLVEFEGEYVSGNGMSEEEEAVIQKFLNCNRSETRSLADIILNKIKEKEFEKDAIENVDMESPTSQIPPKVLEVYTAVGKLLQHYRSGKLPKAVKMIPHLKNWEEILWVTRPDNWSAQAVYACTRVFCSNLSSRQAQRFYNIILLEKCRDDIGNNHKLNYHLYMALKKALYKPGAFYKGILLPLAQSMSCTLREATIFGSVLAKSSVQANHSAAALLRMLEMPYCGSTSMFIRVLVNKKYSLPRRVVDALVDHFCNFMNETRVLPVCFTYLLLLCRATLADLYIILFLFVRYFGTNLCLSSLKDISFSWIMNKENG